MNDHVHPILASALFALTPQGMNAIREAKREAYIEALKGHDWYFEFSEDPQVVSRGREQNAQLRLAQRELDADWTIWNMHCDPLFKVHPLGDLERAVQARSEWRLA